MYYRDLKRWQMRNTPNMDNIILPGEFVVSRDFKEMIKRSYAFNRKLFISDWRWGILEELYYKNYLITSSTMANIPKIIHQIWLGGTMPDVYKKYADTWRKFNPTWKYKLWTDDDVVDLSLPNKELYDSMTNYGPKSDLLRYYFLQKYGGLYIDTDFECVKSFDNLCYLGFYTSIAYNAEIELYPGLIGCVPHHPIIERMVEGVCQIKEMPESGIGVLETISSYFFTRIFWEVIKGYIPDVVAFPMDYFYPFPNQGGHHTRNGEEYIKDCSYAVHHWAVSWLNK